MNTDNINKHVPLLTQLVQTTIHHAKQQRSDTSIGKQQHWVSEQLQTIIPHITDYAAIVQIIVGAPAPASTPDEAIDQLVQWGFSS